MRLRYREVNDLANLPACRAAAGPELQALGAATVPRYAAVVVGGLYIAVETMARRYIAGGRSRGHVERPALSQHHHLAQLPPGHVAVRAELQPARPNPV